METLFPTLVLIILALVGARVSFSTERVRLGARLLFRTGIHFVLVGFALGPSGLRLLTPDVIEQLFPLLALGLGWVGFQFGLQLERHSLERFPRSYYGFALGQAALALLIFTGAALTITRVGGLEGPVPVLLVLGAGCTAAVSAPAGIAMISSTFQVKGRVRDLLLFAGSIDAIVGIVALQVTYALFRPDVAPAAPGAFSQLAFVGIALGVGVVCGTAFLWLTRSRPASEELVLFLLGACAFASGVALQWSLSPLFVAMTMGALVANLSRSTQRIRLVLARWEKAVYVTFLLLAGVLLQVSTWLLLPMALGYALLRIVAKLVGAWLVAAVVPLGFDVPKPVGLGLIPQGGIAVAMALSALLMYSDIQVRGLDAEALLFAVIVIGVSVSELSGPLLTLRLLRGAGEISAEATWMNEPQPR